MAQPPGVCHSGGQPPSDGHHRDPGEGLTVSFALTLQNKHINKKTYRELQRNFTDGIITACLSAGISATDLLLIKTYISPLRNPDLSRICCELCIPANALELLASIRDMEGYIRLPSPWEGRVGLQILSKNMRPIRLFIDTNNAAISKKEVKKALKHMGIQKIWYLERACYRSNTHALCIPMATQWLLDGLIPEASNPKFGPTGWRVNPISSLPPEKWDPATPSARALLHRRSSLETRQPAGDYKPSYLQALLQPTRPQMAIQPGHPDASQKVIQRPAGRLSRDKKANKQMHQRSALRHHEPLGVKPQVIAKRTMDIHDQPPTPQGDSGVVRLGVDKNQESQEPSTHDNDSLSENNRHDSPQDEIEHCWVTDQVENLEETWRLGLVQKPGGQAWWTSLGDTSAVGPPNRQESDRLAGADKGGADTTDKAEAQHHKDGSLYAIILSSDSNASSAMHQHLIHPPADKVDMPLAPDTSIPYAASPIPIGQTVMRTLALAQSPRITLSPNPNHLVRTLLKTKKTATKKKKKQTQQKMQQPRPQRSCLSLYRVRPTLENGGSYPI